MKDLQIKPKNKLLLKIPKKTGPEDHNPIHSDSLVCTKTREKIIIENKRSDLAYLCRHQIKVCINYTAYIWRRIAKKQPIK